MDRPSRADNTELLDLAWQVLLNPGTEAPSCSHVQESGSLGTARTHLNAWCSLIGGVFTTAYTAEPRVSANLYCCQGYLAQDSVWNNTSQSARACATRDDRRFGKTPKTLDLTVLQPRPWPTVRMQDLSAAANQTIELANETEHLSAEFLPSVWRERTDWSADHLLRELYAKATDGRSWTGEMNDATLAQRDWRIRVARCCEIEPDGQLVDHGFFLAQESSGSTGTGSAALARSAVPQTSRSRQVSSSSRSPSVDVSVVSDPQDPDETADPKVREPMAALKGWYPTNPRRLSQDVDRYLSVSPDTLAVSQCAATSLVQKAAGSEVLAIIAPHAGYEFSGPVAGVAFASALGDSGRLAPRTDVQRVLVLGVPHFLDTTQCLVSPFSDCRVPGGVVPYDTEAAARLLQWSAQNREAGQSDQSLFELLDQKDDEAEHSVEMELPFVARCFPRARVLPLLVGELDPVAEDQCARALCDVLRDGQRTFVVVSSDMCHLGPRYAFHAKDVTPVSTACSLDAEALRALMTLDPKVFRATLARSGDTVCGRRAIGLLLRLIQVCRGHEEEPLVVRVLDYAVSDPQAPPGHDVVGYAAVSIETARGGGTAGGTLIDPDPGSADVRGPRSHMAMDKTPTTTMSRALSVARSMSRDHATLVRSPSSQGSVEPSTLRF